MADRIAAALALAQQLVGSVHQHDADEIAQVLATVTCSCSCDHTRLYALAVVLAAMVPDDRTPHELLRWSRDPQQYRQLRELGFTYDRACTYLEITEEVA